MTTHKEALTLALEALENTSPLGFNMESDKRFYAAITAIKEALAQPEQEPVVEFKSPQKRWGDGDDHDPRSEVLYKFIADTDFKHCGDSFCFKSGGDGDNGETLMFILDCWFATHGIGEKK